MSQSFNLALVCSLLTLLGAGKFVTKLHLSLASSHGGVARACSHFLYLTSVRRSRLHVMMMLDLRQYACHYRSVGSWAVQG